MWANSCNKLFIVYLGKPWNYQWCCYQKAPRPLVAPFWKVRGSMPPSLAFTVWHFATNCATVTFVKARLRLVMSHDSWGISSPPRTAPPVIFPRGKEGRINEKKMNIRGSIHDNAQIKLVSTLSQHLDVVFMATRVACLPQNTFSNCMLCRAW